MTCQIYLHQNKIKYRLLIRLKKVKTYFLCICDEVQAVFIFNERSHISCEELILYSMGYFNCINFLKPKAWTNKSVPSFKTIVAVVAIVSKLHYVILHQ